MLQRIKIKISTRMARYSRSYAERTDTPPPAGCLMPVS